jgi:hypothetical protein
MPRSNTEVTRVTSPEDGRETRLPAQKTRLGVSSSRLDGAKFRLPRVISTSLRRVDSPLRTEVPAGRFDVSPLHLDGSRMPSARRVVPSRGCVVTPPRNVAPSRKFCLRFAEDFKTPSRDSKTSCLVLEEPTSGFEPGREDVAERPHVFAPSSSPFCLSTASRKTTTRAPETFRRNLGESARVPGPRPTQDFSRCPHVHCIWSVVRPVWRAHMKR